MSKIQKEGTNTTEDNDRSKITEDVNSATYYHGLISHADVESLLLKDGNYLLRKTEHTPGSPYS
jgi:hypothetical protein